MAAKKHELLVNAHFDGRANALAFVSDHQLEARWVAIGLVHTEQRASAVFRVDLEQASVEETPATQRVGEGALADGGAFKALRAEPGAGEIAIRHVKTQRVVRTLRRTGKYPHVRFLDEDTLFSARGEVLNRWNLKTGKAHKFKCHDDVTHVASTPALLAACNKEGVISIFDARKPKRLVCVRPLLNGSWIAFDDTGAWDASAKFDGRGVELSWSDAKSTAFVPDTGFGWLELNQFPLTRIVASKAGRTPGLLALRTAGKW